MSRSQNYTINVDRFKSHQHSNAITTRGKYATMYKKKANKVYEIDIINQLEQQFKEIHNNKQLNGCISLDLTLFVKIPTTLNKVSLKVSERREMTNKYAPRKPDLTNIIKTIEDCVERAGIIEDDLQIVKYDISKIYNDDIKDKYETAHIKLKELE